MPGFAELDAITLDALRATGATKWNRRDGALGAFIAEMDYGIAPQITRALHREVERGLFGYLPPRYVHQMRASVARYLRERHDWEVAESRIHEMPDVVAIYQAAIEHFSRPGSKVIVPTPAYMPLLSLPPTLGREVIEVPMTRTADGAGFRNDLAAIERAFDAGGQLLALCNPHNPTGRVFTRDELVALEDVVHRKDGRVFADEIWMPLVFPGHAHIPYASIGERAAAHTITGMAASKGFNLPGLKCAQLIVSNDADQAHWNAVGVWAMHGAANLGLAGTTAAFDEALPWLDDIRAYLVRNRDALLAFVAERMPRVRVCPPEGTYIAWLDFSDYRFERGAQAFFLEKAGVLCTDGAACGRTGEDHLRFIFAMPLPLMREALERMAEALDAA